MRIIFLKLAILFGIISPNLPDLPRTEDISPFGIQASKNEEFIAKMANLEAMSRIETPLSTSSPEIAAETCVSYARRRAPQIVARVNSASEISATKEIPTVGAWLLWRPNKNNPDGHVSVIEEIKDDKILISEANLYLDGKITWRWVDIHDSKIKGYRY